MPKGDEKVGKCRRRKMREEEVDAAAKTDRMGVRLENP